MSPPLLLASQSRTRAALLAAAGLAFATAAPGVDEAGLKAALLAETVPPRDIADALAEAKALKLSRRHPESIVIGADQVLAHRGAIFDKPGDRAAARAQLLRLRGESHELFSAAVVAVGGEPVWREIGRARLTMRPFSDSFLDDYLDREGDAVLASCGSYRVEGPGIQLFSAIEGDWFSILGLPLLPLLAYLRQRGACTQ